MRILLATVFTILGSCLGIAVAFALRLHGPMLIGLLLAFTVASLIGALVLAERADNWWRPSSKPLSVAELESLGRIRRVNFRAVRAFQVDEFEDEGVHYVIELEDGRVLYLNGQYLYDHEPDAYGAAPGSPRRFPCTDFALLQDIQNGCTIDVDCRGSVLEPECIVPHPRRWPPEHDDGQIAAGLTYEQLKASLAGGGAA